ncbi:ABC transporter permease [Brackiella oedipodis]|uniref:ABC transporter permease n=1 Tax=Brackiella oedipodis TaxID=124225 RepID=UPI00048DED91|nr:ABC transporter permease [Brackiella oedipodis]
MDLYGLAIQLLNGLTNASSLFIMAVGLSLIFGVSRIVNFAHGSFCMLGLYIAYSLTHAWSLSVWTYWLSILAAAFLVACLGALLEILILRRIYQAPEIFQLLATFAILLMISDAVLAYWGPEDLLGPQAPGLSGSVSLLTSQFPSYDLFLIVLGPFLLLLLWCLLKFTRFGLLIRAATQDREMLAALGVNQKRLFTEVFFLGAFLAGLGGAIQLPREPANLALDLSLIGEAFAVVIIGGMSSIPGAFLAALILGELKAICLWLGTQTIFGITIEFSQLTLIVQFLAMALVLILRPWGLLGKKNQHPNPELRLNKPLYPAPLFVKCLGLLCLLILCCLPLLADTYPYVMILAIDILIAILFASSLHLIIGTAGLISFGHAAYFGLGAYTAAICALNLEVPMWLGLLLGPLGAFVAAIILGWFSVRLTGIYMAMLTLAFAELIWSTIFQWDGFTGGSNGLIGVWPDGVFGDATYFYYLVLFIVTLAILLIRWLNFSSLGAAIRATRDSDLRSQALGIGVKQTQWLCFALAGLFAGLAGALFVYSKGSVSPEELDVARSVDGLIMVLLGGMQSLIGPWLGAAVYTALHDYVTSATEHWKALLGALILLLVFVRPKGLMSLFERLHTRSTS